MRTNQFIAVAIFAAALITLQPVAALATEPAGTVIKVDPTKVGKIDCHAPCVVDARVQLAPPVPAAPTPAITPVAAPPPAQVEVTGMPTWFWVGLGALTVIGGATLVATIVGNDKDLVDPPGGRR